MIIVSVTNGITTLNQVCSIISAILAAILTFYKLRNLMPGSKGDRKHKKRVHKTLCKK